MAIKNSTPYRKIHIHFVACSRQMRTVFFAVSAALFEALGT